MAASTSAADGAVAAAAAPLVIPQFIQDRIAVWDEIATENAAKQPAGTHRSRVLGVLSGRGVMLREVA